MRLLLLLQYVPHITWPMLTTTFIYSLQVLPGRGGCLPCLGGRSLEHRQQRCSFCLFLLLFTTASIPVMLTPHGRCCLVDVAASLASAHTA